MVVFSAAGEVYARNEAAKAGMCLVRLRIASRIQGLNRLDYASELADAWNVAAVGGAVLGGVIVYIYTVIAYSMFRDDMILDNYPDEDIPMCTDLLVCFLNTFNEGLRGGDIGAIIDPSAPADGSVSYTHLTLPTNREV